MTRLKSRSGASWRATEPLLIPRAHPGFPIHPTSLVLYLVCLAYRHQALDDVFGNLVAWIPGNCLLVSSPPLGLFFHARPFSYPNCGLFRLSGDEKTPRRCPQAMTSSPACTTTLPPAKFRFPGPQDLFSQHPLLTFKECILPTARAPLYASLTRIHQRASFSSPLPPTTSLPCIYFARLSHTPCK